MTVLAQSPHAEITAQVQNFNCTRIESNLAAELGLS